MTLENDNFFEELKSRVFAPIPNVIGVIAGFICGISGPFQTYMVDIVPRFLFWVPTVFVSIYFGIFISIAVRRLMPRSKQIVVYGVQVIAFAIPYWVFLLVFTHLLYGDFDETPPLSKLLLAIGIMVAVIVVRHLVVARGYSDKKAPMDGPLAMPLATNGAVVVKGTVEKKSHRFLGDDASKLIRMEMRDHYIEVHTDAGMRTYHMRFSDAVENLPIYNGGVTHRSHWANFDEIQEIRRKDGKICLIMSDGHHVPVARSRRAELVKLGIL